MDRPNAASGSDLDLVRAYLRDIGRHSLLTHEEELELARSIEAGRCAAGRLGPGLSRREREEIADAMRVADEARKAFARANLRLVVSIARRYQGIGLPLLDLIQEGNLGLLRAIEKFDWRLGFKFSTYATWWIRQSISRGLSESARTIRLPVHVGEALHRLRRVTEDLMDRLGIDPRDADVAQALGVATGQVEHYRRLAQDPLSLSSPVGPEATTELHEFIPDPEAECPMEIALRWDTSNEVRLALGRMHPRERRILELRFGIADGETHTLESVGREFGLTRERIRQIESKALAKLRHPATRKTLEGLLD